MTEGMKNISEENMAGQWQDEVTHPSFLIPSSTQIYPKRNYSCGCYFSCDIKM